MTAPSEHHDADAKRNPLIPVGLTVLAILVIPLGIYSFGPEGPIKKNHVVFSTGQHRAHFVDETPGNRLLHPAGPEVLVGKFEERTDGLSRPDPRDTETGVPCLSSAHPGNSGAALDALGRLFIRSAPKVRSRKITWYFRPGSTVPISRKAASMTTIAATVSFKPATSCWCWKVRRRFEFCIKGLPSWSRHGSYLFNFHGVTYPRQRPLVYLGTTGRKQEFPACRRWAYRLARQPGDSVFRASNFIGFWLARTPSRQKWH